MVISITTQTPTLVYRKIVGIAVPSSNILLEIATHLPVNHFPALRLDCLANAKEVVEQMFEDEEFVDGEMNDVLTSIISGAEIGLHNCKIDVRGNDWYFVEKGKEKHVLMDYFKNTDPEYLGGFDRDIILSCFESGYDRDIAAILQSTEEFEALGNCIIKHEGVLERLVNSLMEEFDIEAILAEQFNHYDGESCYKTTLRGVEYYYFDQS